MSLVRWDPFADMAQLREHMNCLFTPSRTCAGQQPTLMRTWAPTVDIVETENDVVLHAELPGMKPEEIDIELTGDLLTIRGERKVEHEEKTKHCVRTERTYGAFQRSFTLGLPIKQEAIHAHYRDGILEITLPKAEEVKPKQIQVQIEEQPAA